MWRLYNTLFTHRKMFKAIFMGLVIAAMVLGVNGPAAADDDGFDP